MLFVSILQITGLPILALSMFASNAGAGCTAWHGRQQGNHFPIHFSGIPKQAKMKMEIAKETNLARFATYRVAGLSCPEVTFSK